MRLLLFSDLHADVSAARSLVDRAADADILVGAGDFANVRRQIAACVEILKAVAKPTVLVAGNNETTEELAEACRGWDHAHVLHGSGISLSGVPFFGLGGGVPVTPFGSWSYDFSEDQAANLLAACPPACVLVSHSPPRGAVDADSRGRSLGSQAVRDAVLRVKPRLVVCGHIHGSAGRRTTLGPTPVINAGPAGVGWSMEGTASGPA